LILDPGKGKEYLCKLTMHKKDILNVRGYIIKPLFGKTQKWYRLE